MYESWTNLWIATLAYNVIIWNLVCPYCNVWCVNMLFTKARREKLWRQIVNELTRYACMLEQADRPTTYILCINIFKSNKLFFQAELFSPLLASNIRADVVVAWKNLLFDSVLSLLLPDWELPDVCLALLVPAL